MRNSLPLIHMQKNLSTKFLLNSPCVSLLCMSVRPPPFLLPTYLFTTLHNFLVILFVSEIKPRLCSNKLRSLFSLSAVWFTDTPCLLDPSSSASSCLQVDKNPAFAYHHSPFFTFSSLGLLLPSPLPLKDIERGVLMELCLFPD